MFVGVNLAAAMCARGGFLSPLSSRYKSEVASVRAGDAFEDECGAGLRGYVGRHVL
jgi:hypothetical protein